MPETIAEQVGALQASRPRNEVFAAEQQRLAATSITPTITLGDAFPEASLIDPHGQPTTLAATRAGGAAVIVFYRGAWCPYCNIALRTYREQLSEPLRQRGITLVAVSPQAPDGSLTMAEKHDLDFAVLSDPGNQLARSLGILTRPSDATRDMQLEHGLDITAVNADGTIDIPMPTTAIVDPDGRLVWIDVHPDHTTRTEPGEIIEAVQALGL